ncbi:MAG: hypothetical protein ACJ8D9_12035, partial [Xanthobacteraceae bacterium]
WTMPSDYPTVGGRGGKIDGPLAAITPSTWITRSIFAMPPRPPKAAMIAQVESAPDKSHIAYMANSAMTELTRFAAFNPQWRQ